MSAFEGETAARATHLAQVTMKTRSDRPMATIEETVIKDVPVGSGQLV